MGTFLTGKIIDAVGDLTERVTGKNHVDSAVDAVHGAANTGGRRARAAAEFIRDGALIRQATASLSDGSAAGASARQTTRAAVQVAAQASFVKELAKICGKAGAAGAVVDGAVGGLRAARHLQQGTIDGRQAMRHVGAEAGCGFVTSASGTAGTLAVFMVTGSMGPAALAAGMGASMGSRYLYRQVIPETLPDEEDIERMKNQAARQARESSEGESADTGETAHTTTPEDVRPDAGSASPAPEADEPSDGPARSARDRQDYGDGPDLEDIGPGRSDEEPPTGRDDANDDNDADEGGPFEDIGPEA